MRASVVAVFASLIALEACSDHSTYTAGATGGTTSTSSGGTGGALSGGTDTGGQTANGGAVSSGGALSSGGTPSSGGKAASTGGSATGGGAGSPSGSGGKAASGGQSANGGSQPTTGGSANGGGGATNAGSAGMKSAGGATTATGGSGGSSTCAATLAQENYTLVTKALDELFVQKDITAVDRYWSDPYLQHNPIAKSGVATFKSLMSGVVSSASFSYQRLRAVAECDLVVVQGRYSSTGVIFDMFRVKSGKIMEHWDSDTNQASDAAGPSEILDSARTAENRARVLAFHQAVLVGGDTTQASTYFAANYSEHHTVSGQTGSAALLKYLTDNQVTYTKAHHAIAMGNFVFVLSEGARRGTAMGFYDLFRVADGNLAEHWDSARSVPSSTMSGLPIF